MRLVTRPDLDGLTCGVLLAEVEPIDDVRFVEPQQLKRGDVAIGPSDILANLPYHPACGLWFDHHASNAPPPERTFRGAFHIDPSAARTIYNHYRDPRLDRHLELLEATDKVDAAQLSLEDVMNPRGYVLLSLTLDSRTNLDDANQSRYCHQLLEWLAQDPIDRLLERPEVFGRTARILQEQASFSEVMKARSRIARGVILTDLRQVDPQPVGGRFVIYALYPECSASIRIYPSRGQPDAVAISVGHSIFRRTQKVSAGALCARYGGGGHFGAASCSVPAGEADRIVAEMLQSLGEGG